jgi:dihydropteroate synthase
MRSWQLRDCSLDLDGRCLVMGIVNVTPDSFSDGGRHADRDAAVQHALALEEEGAELLDIGGESTRPGSQPVAADEELRRVLPVVEALAGRVRVPISIDTSKAAVARACLAAGAHIVNDVTGLSDPAMVDVVREHQAGAIIMHMQGTPATMQLAPKYDNVVHDLFRFFQQRLTMLTQQGIAQERIVIDPGIGFGKTREHNLELLARLDAFQQLGRPLCLGVSRKGLLKSKHGRQPHERLAGSLAVAGFALAHNAAQVLRVHDVAATRDLVALWQALAQRRAAGG